MSKATMLNLSWMKRAPRLSAWRLVGSLGLALAGVIAGYAAEPLYQNDFEQMPAGTDLGNTEEFMVIEGSFTVREAEGNRFVELPGTPLGGFAMLFGPSKAEGIAVSARIYGTRRGRRYPVFGVGLNGMGGYRLLVAPAKRAIELWRGETRLTAVPFQWKSGTWTRLKLQLRRIQDGLWRVEGRVWYDGEPEPKTWTIAHEVSQKPFAGKPSIWGEPFADTPIRFDDLTVTPVE